MRIRIPVKRPGIKYQILLVTLIPVFLIDVFITYASFNSSIEQASELLQIRGQTIAKQIAGASESILKSGESARIQYLLDQSIGTNSIVEAAVFSQGKLIAKSVSDQYRTEDRAGYFYVVNNFDDAASLCRNNSNSGHRCVLKLRGTQSNRFGIGARVQV